jgi:hypothetical protein
MTPTAMARETPLSTLDAITGSAKLAFDTEDVESLTDKTRIMLQSLVAWFNTHPRERATLIRILYRREQFSLRLIDWMVTNFSRTHRIVVRHNDGLLDIHDDYQRHLSVFNKKLFDPFARRHRIRIAPPYTAMTTVGQLNFMRWFLARRVDLIIPRHQAAIETHMRACTSTKRTGKRDDVEACIAEAAVMDRQCFVVSF